MRSHLQYSWWKYLAIVLIPVIVWSSIFNILRTPDPDQRVHILYVGSHLDTQVLQSKLSAVLPGLTSQELKSVTVTTADTEAMSYSTLDARCFDYDILIFEESYMPEKVGQAVFVRLTDALLKQFPQAVYYQEDVEDAGILTYGFCISPTEHTPFTDCYSGTQRCYLFVSPRSVNFDTLNENGRAGNDGALKAAQYLLEKTP